MEKLRQWLENMASIDKKDKKSLKNTLFLAWCFYSKHEAIKAHLDKPTQPVSLGEPGTHNVLKLEEQIDNIRQIIEIFYSPDRYIESPIRSEADNDSLSTEHPEFDINEKKEPAPSRSQHFGVTTRRQWKAQTGETPKTSETNFKKRQYSKKSEKTGAIQGEVDYSIKISSSSNINNNTIDKMTMVSKWILSNFSKDESTITDIEKLSKENKADNHIKNDVNTQNSLEAAPKLDAPLNTPDESQHERASLPTVFENLLGDPPKTPSIGSDCSSWLPSEIAVILNEHIPAPPSPSIIYMSRPPTPGIDESDDSGVNESAGSTRSIRVSSDKRSPLSSAQSDTSEEDFHTYYMKQLSEEHELDGKSDELAQVPPERRTTGAPVTEQEIWSDLMLPALLSPVSDVPQSPDGYPLSQSIDSEAEKKGGTPSELPSNKTRPTPSRSRRKKGEMEQAFFSAARESKKMLGNSLPPRQVQTIKPSDQSSVSDVIGKIMGDTGFFLTSESEGKDSSRVPPRDLKRKHNTLSSQGDKKRKSNQPQAESTEIVKLGHYVPKREAQISTRGKGIEETRSRVISALQKSKPVHNRHSKTTGQSLFAKVEQQARKKDPRTTKVNFRKDLSDPSMASLKF